MKKLLLATAVVFAASQASAAVYNVSLEGTQTQTSPDGSINLGGGTTTTLTNGTYDSETGVLSFASGALKTEQDANVFGTIVNLTLASSMTVNFTAKTGANNVETCAGRTGTDYAAGGAKAAQAGFACGFATGNQELKEITSIDIANPFNANNQFSFSGKVFNSQATVTQSFTITNLNPPTSEVPVPAAAWLFGSALAGLAGLRKRK